MFIFPVLFLSIISVFAADLDPEVREGLRESGSFCVNHSNLLAKELEKSPATRAVYVSQLSKDLETSEKEEQLLNTLYEKMNTLYKTIETIQNQLQEKPALDSKGKSALITAASQAYQRATDAYKRNLSKHQSCYLADEQDVVLATASTIKHITNLLALCPDQ